MDNTKMTLFKRIEKAMDIEYIQEHPDEVIELLVEVKAEIERLYNLRADEIREIAERWEKDD
jgi:hypothetical protein